MTGGPCNRIVRNDCNHGQHRGLDIDVIAGSESILHRVLRHISVQNLLLRVDRIKFDTADAARPACYGSHAITSPCTSS